MVVWWWWWCVAGGGSAGGGGGGGGVWLLMLSCLWRCCELLLAVTRPDLLCSAPCKWK